MPTSPQSTAESPPARDPALDGLRGMAVLLVVLFHYGGGLRAQNPLLRALGYLTQASWIGVNLFFALSGFLITGLLAQALLDASRGPVLGANAGVLGNFYARRALRILPLYFAALLACAVAALLNGAKVSQLKPLLVYATFLQNLPPLLNMALHTPPPLPIFHLWSLAVEEQFYLLWPLALVAARTPRRAFHLSLFTFIASCCFRFAVFAPHVMTWSRASDFATFLPTRAGALALGSALALYRLQHGQAVIPAGSATTGSRKERTLAFVALAFSVLLLVAAGLRTHSLLLNNRPGYLVLLPAADLLSAAIVAVALSPNLLRSVLGMQPLVFLGRISYGIYVLHILLELLFDRLGATLTHSHSGFAFQGARLAMALLLTTITAWLSFTLLEQPFLRLKQRLPQVMAGTR